MMRRILQTTASRACSCVLLFVLLLGVGALPAAAQTTFTVINTADTDDGACDQADCTLREAINAANAAAGDDTIEFNIPGERPL